MISTKQKRILLFVFGCLLTRTLFAYIAQRLSNPVTKTDIKYSYLLPYFGYLALIPAFGFAIIYFTDSRKTGPEVFGGKIWWNNLRPVHALLYFLFANLAIRKNTYAWIPLALDVLIGATAALWYHTN